MELCAIVLTSSLLGLMPPGFGELMFPGRVYDQGVTFNAIAPGDFDGDGDIDVVVLDNAAREIVVMRNNGLGAFAKLSAVGLFPDGYRVESGETPELLCVEDLDDDGFPDVVVVRRDSHLRVLLNDGRGVLAEKAQPAEVWGDRENDGVGAADFNGDGHVDIAVANNSSSPGDVNGENIAFAWGDGHGALSEGPVFVLDGSPIGLVVCDINADTFPDVVTSTWGDGTMVALLGDGEGGFTPLSDPLGIPHVRGIKAADLNGDTHDDFLIYAFEGSPSSVEWSVVLSDGSGGFEPPTGLGYDADPVILTDLDGDGDADVLITDDDDAYSGMRIYWNDGSGGFDDVQYEDTYVGPSGDSAAGPRMIVADLNSDGVADVVSDPTHVGAFLAVNLAEAPGVFPAWTILQIGFVNERTEFVDLDGDGVVDLTAWGDSYDYHYVRFGEGGGEFGPEVKQQIPHSFFPGPGALEYYDVDGDSNLDAMLIYPDLTFGWEPLATGVQVLLSRGDGTFDFPVAQEIVGWATRCVIGDGDGDGAAELVYFRRDESHVPEYQFCAAAIDENGVLGEPICTPWDPSYELGKPYFVSVKGDGDMELLIETEILTLYTIANDWSVARRVSIVPLGVMADWTIGDYDADGDDDFVIVLEGRHWVETYTNDGDGSFAYGAIPLAGYQKRVALGDLDRDGLPDIVSSDSNAGVAIYKNLGEGRYANPVRYLTGVTPIDIDGDGFLDLTSGTGFVLNLLSACPADLNTKNTNPGEPGFGEPDGVVDGADLSYYVEKWLSMDPAADVTTLHANPGDPGYGEPDGLVDGADLGYFVEAWLAGCV